MPRYRPRVRRQRRCQIKEALSPPNLLTRAAAQSRFPWKNAACHGAAASPGVGSARCPGREAAVWVIRKAGGEGWSRGSPFLTFSLSSLGSDTFSLNSSAGCLQAGEPSRPWPISAGLRRELTHAGPGQTPTASQLHRESPASSLCPIPALESGKKEDEMRS